MAVSVDWGVLWRVPFYQSLLCGVDIRAPDFWKLPCCFSRPPKKRAEDRAGADRVQISGYGGAPGRLKRYRLKLPYTNPKPNLHLSTLHICTYYLRTSTQLLFDERAYSVSAWIIHCFMHLHACFAKLPH